MTSVAQPISTGPRTVRWTRQRYYQLVHLDTDLLPKRSFLFRGELIEMPPMKEPHAQGVMRVCRWVDRSFDAPRLVRVQMPLDVPGDSVPGPDVLVCLPEHLHRDRPPATGVLVIEVADSSVSLDRSKADEYAAAGIPEYWLLNLGTRRLELHREPVEDTGTPTGWRYASVRLVAEHEQVAPWFAKEVAVWVSELLPEPDDDATDAGERGAAS